MTRLSGVGVYQRAAATMVRSRPLGVVENALSTRTRVRAHAGIIDRENRAARVSFQSHHTVIAAAAAAAVAARSKCRALGVLRAERACAAATYAERSSSSITGREEMRSWSQN